ncbi:MAG: TIGR04211 family SH3 domain-containing protein, partial [Desulfobacterales bacterium]|nr:TIGR04211 family SH3 domain-containing protein [Desulfobacterales bacterium]
MKSFIVFFIVLFSTVVQAETMYIGDNIKITVRTGPGISHKIVAMIKPGETVELLNSEEIEKDWSLVRITNGKEGWVLSRFLTSKEPDGLVLERLGKKHGKLTNQAVSLIEENKVYKKENEKLNLELKTNKEMSDKIKSSYETLKQES